MSGGVAGVPINACVAEFVGTFLLIFTVGCNVLSGNATWGAVSIACVLMVSIYAFGAVSGGHFNPAVSVALQLAHKLDQGWTQVVVYCVAQICGGVCAAFSYTALFNKHFSLAPKAELWAGALLVEGIYTFLLCLVVLNAAASKAKAGKNQYFGLAIGFVIIAGGYGAGALGAGCFNPAVAISITAASEDKNVKTCFSFIVVELIGAAMAVVLTALVRPEEARDGALPPQSPPGYSLQSKLLSEVIGTYILVLTVARNPTEHPAQRSAGQKIHLHHRRGRNRFKMATPTQASDVYGDMGLRAEVAGLLERNRVIKAEQARLDAISQSHGTGVRA